MNDDDNDDPTVAANRAVQCVCLCLQSSYSLTSHVTPVIDKYLNYAEADVFHTKFGDVVPPPPRRSPMFGLRGAKTVSYLFA